LKNEIKTLEYNLIKVKQEIENIIIAVKQGLFNDLINEELNKLETKKNEIIIVIEKNKEKLNQSKEINTFLPFLLKQ